MTLREEFENNARVNADTCSSEVNTMYDISDFQYIIWLENKINNIMY